MKHCIIVKFKETISPAEREAMYPEIYALFAKTKTIPGIYDVRLIPNCITRPNRYDLVIEITMDEAALPLYDASCYHLEWKTNYGGLLQSKTIIDLDVAYTPSDN